MFKYLFILCCIVFFFLPSSSYAIVDPLDHPNNIYGIHISDESDLYDADRLVNSSGGDWGYVTLVIRENERNIERWQKAFDEMRKLHLIPIVRIATQSDKDGNWEKFEIDDIENWIYFLNSINWVVENRYVLIGNEPNHSVEWEGDINPQEYAEYLIEFAKRAKSASNDFFILPAALDASAPTNKDHMNEEEYLFEIFNTKPEYFKIIDGISSHSYPNPDFSGSQYASGRGSIKTFMWERDLYTKYGSKELPIFITETGWTRSNALSEKEIADRLLYAFNHVWNDNNVVAVTPFILKYNHEPFDQFSWVDNEGRYYDYFSQLSNVKKIKGEPKIKDFGEIKYAIVPQASRPNQNVKAYIYVENVGQAIWNKLHVNIENLSTQTIDIEVVPNEKQYVEISFTPVADVNTYDSYVSLLNDKREVISNKYYFRILIIHPEKKFVDKLIEFRSNLAFLIKNKIKNTNLFSFLIK